MAEQIETPSRFLVHGKIIDGVPCVEIVDNLACAGLMFELTVALDIAANMTMAASSMIALAQTRAQQQRQGIIKANGQPARVEK